MALWVKVPAIKLEFDPLRPNVRPNPSPSKPWVPCPVTFHLPGASGLHWSAVRPHFHGPGLGPECLLHPCRYESHLIPSLLAEAVPARKPKEGVGSSGIGVTDGLELPSGYWELKPGTLKE